MRPKPYLKENLRTPGSDEFLAPAWRERLETSGLANFERLWRLELPPLDSPNTTRGGISTVGVLALAAHDRQDRRLVVKRQRNHQSRTWRHPLQGIPTSRKEFINIRRFECCGLAPPAPVFFAQRRDNRGTRAILMTEFLEGYQALDSVLAQWAREPGLGESVKDAILRPAADLVARMHRAGFRHNCLYPKHLFVNTTGVRKDIRLIDLEKAARTRWAARRMTRDLGALFRNSAHWSAEDQMRFLVHYAGATRMTPAIERSWRQIRRGMARKNRRRPPG